MPPRLNTKDATTVWLPKGLSLSDMEVAKTVGSKACLAIHSFNQIIKWYKNAHPKHLVS